MTAAATIEAKFIAEFEESPVATEGEAMNVEKEMAIHENFILRISGK